MSPTVLNKQVNILVKDSSFYFKVLDDSKVRLLNMGLDVAAG